MKMSSGGFYINESSLPVGSEWVPNLSLVYWGFQALVINEFSDERFTCGPSEVRCVSTGEQVIANLSFSVSTTATLMLTSVLIN